MALRDDARFLILFKLHAFHLNFNPGKTDPLPQGGKIFCKVNSHPASTRFCGFVSRLFIIPTELELAWLVPCCPPGVNCLTGRHLFQEALPDSAEDFPVRAITLVGSLMLPGPSPLPSPSNGSHYCSVNGRSLFAQCCGGPRITDRYFNTELISCANS